jgi:uncharacterized membrane protein YdjX (TVP38/TMEM64 family)
MVTNRAMRDSPGRMKTPPPVVTRSIRILLGAGMVCGLGGLLWWSELGVRDLLVWLERLEAVGPGPFALGVIAWALLMLPASVQMGAAGFLYGPVAGAFVGWALSVTASCVAFALGRTLVREPVLRRVRTSARWRALEAEIGARGTYVVMLARMSPLFPYNIISYALGVAPLSFRDFALGTSIGVIPVAILNAVMGAGVASLAQLLDGGPPPRGVVLVGAGLTVLATGLATRLASRALALPPAEGPSTSR